LTAYTEVFQSYVVHRLKLGQIFFTISQEVLIMI